MGGAKKQRWPTSSLDLGWNGPRHRGGCRPEAPRGRHADMLAAYDAVTANHRKSQQNWEMLVNRGRHAAHTASSLGQLAETGRPRGPGDPLVGGGLHTLEPSQRLATGVCGG